MIPNELDEQYILDAQDPNEPVWESDGVIAEMQQVDDPNDQVPVLRDSSGALAFFNDLREVEDPFLERDRPVPDAKVAPLVVRTRELGSSKWRARTAVLDARPTNPLLTQSNKRRRVTLRNFGPNVAYVSHMPNPVVGSPNMIRLPVCTATLDAPVVLSTQDDVWAVVGAGLAATVDVYEEFDLEC